MGHRLARTLLRVFTLGVVTASVGLCGSALADEPESWQRTPHVSGLDFILVLFLAPLALFLLISLLAALPGMMGGRGYRSGQPWTGEGEWLGGPREGVESADDPQALASAGDQGGTGAGY